MRFYNTFEIAIYHAISLYPYRMYLWGSFRTRVLKLLCSSDVKKK